MGVFRLFLALSVIATHSQTTVFGFKGIGSGYAVNCFFIISGFYMAMVLNGKYRDTPVLHFYKSRVFRLLPVYFVGLLLALLISREAIATFFHQLTFGSRIFFVLQNLFVFGQDLAYVFCTRTDAGTCAEATTLTINPPAWSLAVELGFYLVAPFLLKSIKKTFLFFLYGCLYMIAIRYIQLPLPATGILNAESPYSFNYYFYPSSFIFFAGGALAYHFRQGSASTHTYLFAALAIGLLSWAQTVVPVWHLMFMGLAIPYVFHFTALNRLDRFIGELSYPAYILHFPFLVLLTPVTLSHPGYFSVVGLGSVVAVASCLVGWLAYGLVERRINRYRNSPTFFDDEGAWNTGVVIRALPAVWMLLYLALPVMLVAYVMIR